MLERNTLHCSLSLNLRYQRTSSNNLNPSYWMRTMVFNRTHCQQYLWLWWPLVVNEIILVQQLSKWADTGHILKTTVLSVLEQVWLLVVSGLGSSAERSGFGSGHTRWPVAKHCLDYWNVGLIQVTWTVISTHMEWMPSSLRVTSLSEVFSYLSLQLPQSQR